MNKFFKVILSVIVAAAALNATAQPTDLYKDMNAPTHDRIMDLLSKMTVDEKISLMIHNARGVPRLGIPKYYMGNEALHGIVRPGKFTVFPQAIALAATWNPELIHQVTTAISDEARGKWNYFEQGKNQRDFSSDLLTFWSPTVNLARDPRWGRTPETYGEDPFLTSAIGVAFTKGLQGDDPRYIKVVSTPKHFAANNEEHNRSHCNAVISERNLREYYLTPFEKLVKDANAQSIMSAYNAVNGVPCSANNWLLQKVLRKDWGFDGFVVSDCSAPAWAVTEHKFVRDYETAAVLMIKAGLDLECAEDVYTQPLKDAYKHYRVSDADIDSAAYRILRARMRLGMFDDPAQVPYTKISPDVVGCKEHQELALETARQSLVLLKNEKNFLPLNAKKLKKIAVVGPNANVIEFGDYSGTPVNEPVSILEGIRRQVGNDAEVLFAPWTQTSEGYEPISRAFFPDGLKAEYFDNAELQGTPRTRTEYEIYYDPASQPPDPMWGTAPMSIRWTGDLLPTVSGEHVLSVRTDDGVRLWIDDKMLIDGWTSHPAQTESVTINLEAGRRYKLKMEYFDGGGECFARMYWRMPVLDSSKLLDLYGEAGKIAREADVVIAVLGIDRSIEREGQDRHSMELPTNQKEFIREIVKVNPNTAVVLVAGSSLSVNWLNDNAPAILDSWYSGEQGGNAVAEALFGKYNPGGRLPLTFYNSLEELPPFDDYAIEKGRTYQYFTGKPLYEFGYGLSYTKFKYSKLAVTVGEDAVNVKFNVKNVGKRDGDEVAQVYVHYPETGVYMPIKQLKGFKRVGIKKGATATVEIAIKKSDLRYWDEKTEQFVTPKGEYNIYVGASSANLPLEGTFTL